MLIKEYIKKIYLKRLLLGVVLGAIGGYSYYYFVGCDSGGCAIKSNPYYMTLWGISLGAVLFYKTKDNNKSDSL